ncbi:hypothetical protein BSY18_4123 (plasmid) [Blastomonas sp. RAC04]|uniref:DUF6118 family protein n=1 Tax=Blastomonas sp. RAC04 TaxID=1842535 RepID=UPI00083D274C|nr:DUF6118 family protein [Blastomonas sp. RAC04]AOF98820.1 hypothetical protein BSY18_4123 [Blastomonas sp. RAC04]
MDDAEPNPSHDEIPIEQALEAVARRLAGVTAAVDGFAERQQDLLGRDYSEDLALIHQSCEDLRVAIDALAQKPALTLTPEMIGRQIEAAGRQVRKDADLALAAVQSSLQNAISALARIAGSVRAVRQQNKWLAGATGLALVLGTIGGAIILPAIDWVVPEGWLWPEKRAMSALRRNGREAGERLLLVADPERWNAIQAATRLSEVNSDAIRKCAMRAADRKLRSVGCTVEVQVGDR